MIDSRAWPSAQPSPECDEVASGPRCSMARTIASIAPGLVTPAIALIPHIVILFPPLFFFRHQRAGILAKHARAAGVFEVRRERLVGDESLEGVRAVEVVRVHPRRLKARLDVVIKRRSGAAHQPSDQRYIRQRGEEAGGE